MKGLFRPVQQSVSITVQADGEIIRLAWEWYLKVRQKMRSKKHVRHAYWLHFAWYWSMF
jgi:hypothetical protein